MDEEVQNDDILSDKTKKGAYFFVKTAGLDIRPGDMGKIEEGDNDDVEKTGN